MRNAGAVPLAAWLLFLPNTALARPCEEIPADYAFREANLIVKGWFEYTRREGVPLGKASSAILRQAVGNADLGVRVRAQTWLTRFGDVDAFRRLT